MGDGRALQAVAHRVMISAAAPAVTEEPAASASDSADQTPAASDPVPEPAVPGQTNPPVQNGGMDDYGWSDHGWDGGRQRGHHGGWDD